MQGWVGWVAQWAVGSSPVRTVESPAACQGEENSKQYILLTAHHKSFVCGLVLTVAPREQKRTDQHRECRLEFRIWSSQHVYTAAGIPEHGS